MALVDVTCSRCGQKKNAPSENPFTGSVLGEKIMKNVCQDCWKEWERTQLMLINEYKLIPATREHRQFLIEQMKRFLNLQ